MIRTFAIEPLEARIAPATVLNPLFDLTPGIGKTGATIDLAKMVDGTTSYRTRIEFTTNFIIPGTTSPGVIVIELFDDKAPLSVQNFLSYFNTKSGDGYDGTFFHRIFDFGDSSESGTDIIQAGGYNVKEFNSGLDHMPTGPTVHNEFNPDDPEVQNTRGSLAMAKTSISPHTGSSEWFINLTNNTSILGEDNNGGFAVFGRIVSGLEIADAIGKAQQVQGEGAFANVPVQNYTTGTAVKVENLIQIIDASVIPAAAGNDQGLTFSAVVKDPDNNGAASSLVKASVDNATNQLKLTYAKNQTGRAEVVVTIHDGTTTTEESFIVDLRTNLIADFSSDTLPSVFVPGDKGTVKVKLTNNVAALAKGAVNIKLFLSAAGPSNNPLTTEAVSIDENDIEITAKGTASVSIASGKSTSVGVSYEIPSTGLVAGQKYFLLAQITQPDGSTLVEHFTDDNTGFSSSNHTYNLAFGDVGGRTKVPLTYTLPNGEALTFTISGKGSGTVTVDGDLIDVSLTGTTGGSNFSIKTAKGVIGDLDDLSIRDTIGSVKLGNIQLHGSFAASAGAKSITFGDLGDGSAGAIAEDKDFTVGAPSPDSKQKVAIKLGHVLDYSFSSALVISSLTALDWLDTSILTQPDTFVAAKGLGKLKIAGDFEANLTVGGTAKVASISVGGTLRDGSVRVLGSIGTATFGNILNSSIQTVGDIATLTTGSITGSTVFVGLTEKPDEVSDFVNGKTIGTFKVNGTFADSKVAASRLNAVTINAVDSNAGTEVGGIYADAIKSYLRKDSGKGKLTNLDDRIPGDNQPEIRDPDPLPGPSEPVPKYQVALF